MAIAIRLGHDAGNVTFLLTRHIESVTSWRAEPDQGVKIVMASGAVFDVRTNSSSAGCARGLIDKIDSTFHVIESFP